MSETKLYADILTAHSHGRTRLMRINAGMAYQGRVLERTPGRLILSPWYPIRLAAEGVSDLLGWTQEEFEGHDIAVFTAIEGKIKGRLTEEQASFLTLVERMGGRAGVARSVEDAGKIIRGAPLT